MFVMSKELGGGGSLNCLFLGWFKFFYLVVFIWRIFKGLGCIYGDFDLVVF